MNLLRLCENFLLLGRYDCARRGWVMDGFPETAEQAKALQAIGIMPKHVIVLEAPDSLLLERAEGKRIDPETQGKKS